LKILHICLASFYIDNYSYQENMLPKYHKKLGMDVEILASLVSFDKNGKSCLLKGGSHYNNEYGIPVTRLEYKKSNINKRLRRYDGTYEAILRARPDIIFVHGCQFLDIKEVAKYAKQNAKVKVYVDNHADFSNSATNWVSKNILHKIVWKYCAHLIEPFTCKFYGVLPARVNFLTNIYGIPKEKIETIRDKHNIEQDDFLIMTGGKIDKAKTQTLLLMQAVQQIERKNVKLLVFGSVVKELQDEVDALVDGVKIQYIGWVSPEDSYNYFGASDLVVFPGRHSVFWEQVAGMGIPMLVKYWEGTTHVDVGGNCAFLHKDNVEEIKGKILRIYNDKKLLNNMKRVAEEKAMKIFSYRNIAQKSLDIKVGKDIPFKSVLINEN